MTFQDFVDGKFVVFPETMGECIQFYEACAEYGLVWGNGTRINAFMPNEYKQQCYRCERFDTKPLLFFGPYMFYESNRYNIIPFSKLEDVTNTTDISEECIMHLLESS